MNYKLEIINPASYPEWNNLALSAQDYSVFHSAEWANVIHSTYKYQPLYYVYKDSEEVNALIPLMIVDNHLAGKKAVCLPFSDYCAPLLLNDNTVFEDLFKKILVYLKFQNIDSLEIRGGTNFLKNIDSSNCFYVHRLELRKSDEELFAGFKGATRRNIKKAVREGIAVKVENTMESVNGFYNINRVTRRDHGLPPQPRLFFENIFSEFISKKKGFVINAFYKDELVASKIFLHFGDKAIFKFGASIKAYQHLRANNIIIWEAIKLYNKLGYKELSLGKTELENTGLRRFKLGWGASEEIDNTYRFSLKNNKFIRFKSYTVGFHNQLFKKMPLIVLEFISEILYKYMG